MWRIGGLSGFLFILVGVVCWIVLFLCFFYVCQHSIVYNVFLFADPSCITYRNVDIACVLNIVTTYKCEPTSSVTSC